MLCIEAVLVVASVRNLKAILPAVLAPPIRHQSSEQLLTSTCCNKCDLMHPANKIWSDIDGIIAVTMLQINKCLSNGGMKLGWKKTYSRCKDSTVWEDLEFRVAMVLTGFQDGVCPFHCEGFPSIRESWVGFLAQEFLFVMQLSDFHGL